MTHRVIQIKGEDGKVYGSFLDRDVALNFKVRLEEAYGPYFDLDEFTLGKGGVDILFRHMVDD